MIHQEINSWRGTEIMRALNQTRLREELATGIANLTSTVAEDIEATLFSINSLSKQARLELQAYSSNPTREQRKEWRKMVKEAKVELRAAKMQLAKLSGEQEAYDKALEVLPVRLQEPLQMEWA